MLRSEPANHDMLVAPKRMGRWNLLLGGGISRAIALPPMLHPKNAEILGFLAKIRDS